MSSLIPKEGGPKPRTGGSHADQGSPRTRLQGPSLKYVVTIAVAATADSLQIAFPPLWIPISLITAVILFSLWGWRWEILVVLVPELAPVIGIFPTWIAIALYLTGRDVKFAGNSHLPKENEMRRVGPRHSTEKEQ